MAEIATSASTPILDIDPLEEAASDLSVAAAMVRAAGKFVGDVRGFVVPGGAFPNAYILPSALDATTMIEEVMDKIKEAQATIEQFVRAAMAARRSGAHAPQ